MPKPGNIFWVLLIGGGCIAINALRYPTVGENLSVPSPVRSCIAPLEGDIAQWQANPERWFDENAMLAPVEDTPGVFPIGPTDAQQLEVLAQFDGSQLSAPMLPEPPPVGGLPAPPTFETSYSTPPRQMTQRPIIDTERSQAIGLADEEALASAPAPVNEQAASAYHPRKPSGFAALGNTPASEVRDSSWEAEASAEETPATVESRTEVAGAYRTAYEEPSEMQTDAGEIDPTISTAAAETRADAPSYAVETASAEIPALDASFPVSNEVSTLEGRFTEDESAWEHSDETVEDWSSASDESYVSDYTPWNAEDQADGYSYGDDEAATAVADDEGSEYGETAYGETADLAVEEASGETEDVDVAQAQSTFPSLRRIAIPQASPDEDDRSFHIEGYVSDTLFEETPRDEAHEPVEEKASARMPAEPSRAIAAVEAKAFPPLSAFVPLDEMESTAPVAPTPDRQTPSLSDFIGTDSAPDAVQAQGSDVESDAGLMSVVRPLPQADPLAEQGQARPTVDHATVAAYPETSVAVFSAN